MITTTKTKKKGIYLDYSASTPVDKKVVEEMLPYFNEKYGNSSAVYSLGQESLFAIDKSRKIIADFLNCKQEEIYFTGSATEANNIAILGLIKKTKKDKSKIHIITSKIEHEAVLEPIKKLEKEGVLVTYLPVDKNGFVDCGDLKKSIKKETVLVSIMYVNNEVGSIQPIKEIGKLIKKENSVRENKIFFHTDAVQAINYLDCRVDHLGVDMLSFSGHKIYGPKGIGVLYSKRETPLEPIIYGGGQEKGLRSGTENVPAIAGIGRAVELVGKRGKDNERIEKLRNWLARELLNKIKGIQVNGNLEKRIPNNINLSFKGAEGESIVMALDQKKIYLSTGSACSSKSLQPSHVLLAMGLSREEAHCSLRISLGKETQKEDIIKLAKTLPDIIERLRKISGRQ